MIVWVAIGSSKISSGSILNAYIVLNIFGKEEISGVLMIVLDVHTMKYPTINNKIIEELIVSILSLMLV